MSKIIVEMTPFVFEDGNIYYFKIVKGTSNYHDLYVYKKVPSKFYKFFNKNTTKGVYKKLNRSSKLVSTGLNIREIKEEIKQVLKLEIRKNRALKFNIDGWDGFVGDVPEEFKKSLKREAKLNDILKR